MNQNIVQGNKYVPVWAPLIIRLALGIVFIAHGSQKVLGAFGGHGIDGTIGMVASLGFKPAVLWGWMAALAEFLGGFAMVFGFLTRLAALALITNMLVAIFKVHGKNGFFLPMGFEFAFVLLMIALSLIASGAGKISLDWIIGNWWRKRKEYHKA